MHPMSKRIWSIIKFKITEKEIKILKFNFRCLICKKEFNLKIRHKEHLQKHSKADLIKSLKGSGYYYYE